MFFEFHSDFCFIKDQQTKETLLKSSAKNDLYLFDFSLTEDIYKFKLPYTTTCVSTSVKKFSSNVHPSDFVDQQMAFLVKKNIDI